MAKIILKLYDIDGCLFHAFPDEERSEEVSAWLINSNQAFFDNEIRDIHHNNYEKVIIAFGTNRQDMIVDRANRNRGGSCFPALIVLQHYMEDKMGSHVVLDPFLMADIYGSKPAGESFRAILRQDYANTTEQHAEAMYDHSKVSLIYAHAHRVVMLHEKTDAIVIDFYDDLPNILSDVKLFFEAHPDLLPSNVVLRLHQYNGVRESVLYSGEIRGVGEVDSRYDWTVRYMSSQTYFFCGEEAGKDHQMDSHAQLKAYHTENRYHMSGRKMEMKMMNLMLFYHPLKQSLSVLKQFIKDEICQLQSDIQITRAANYVQAKLLALEGLIPERLIVMPSAKKIIPAVPEQSALAADVNAMMPPKPVSEASISSSISGFLWSTLTRTVSLFAPSQLASSGKDSAAASMPASEQSILDSDPRTKFFSGARY